MATTTQKKPPDPLRTVKTSFKSIIKPELNQEIIFDAVNRTHQIVIHTYQFLRLWILNKYHNNQEMSEITTDTISMCMKSIMKSSSGQKPKGNNAILLEEFQKLNTFELEDGINLSSILDYYATTMITSIENNIKMRFFDYIKRFVNSYFKFIYKDKIENKEFKKQLYDDANSLRPFLI